MSARGVLPAGRRWRRGFASLQRAGGVGAVAVLLACSRPAPPQSRPAPRAQPSARAAAASPPRGGPEAEPDAGADGAGGVAPGSVERPGLSPLVAPAPFVELEVPGHGAAVVSLPLGAAAPRPLLVATHGNYDRPDWTCAVWREVVGNDAFVLCPRGAARPDPPALSDPRYHYLTNQHLEREIEQGLASLATAFPDRVAPPPHAFAGFSQGAIMGVAILGRRPEWFDRAVLIEGGFDRWTSAKVAAFAAAGGRRVLFACGQWDCERGARAAIRWFEAAGLEARVVFAKGAGHSYGGELSELIGGEWAWFRGEDERWTTGAPAPASP